MSNVSIIEQCNISRWVGKEPVPLEFVIQRIAPKNMVTLLVAEGGMGKTMIMQQACSSVAIGTDWLGLPASKGKAAGIFAEDPDEVLHNRQFNICNALNIDIEDLADKVFIISQTDESMVLWENEKPTELMHNIEDQLNKITGLILLTIDNAALVFNGNENDRGDVSKFMSHLNKLAKRLNVSIILSTHSSKSTDGSSLRMASGSTAWINASRSVIKLSKKNSGDEAPTLSLEKSNHARTGEVAELAWENNILIKPAEASSLQKSIKSSQIRAFIIKEVRSRQDGNSILSSAHQSTGRYLPSVLNSISDYRFRELKREMANMMAEGVLIIHQKSARSPKGLIVETVGAEKNQSVYAEEISF